MHIERELMLLIVWALSGVVALWFGVMAYILQYHWDKYSLSEERMHTARARYYRVATVCGVALLLFLVLYTISAL